MMARQMFLAFLFVFIVVMVEGGKGESPIRPTPGMLVGEERERGEEKRTSFARKEEDAEVEGFFFSDPRYADQWHLQNYGQVDEGNNLVDLNVADVWAAGYFGKGVCVAVVDSRVEVTHPDLIQNFNLSLYYDGNVGYNVNPQLARHAVAVAGLIGARANNNVCGAGVAPQVTLGNIRILDATPAHDDAMATALTHENQIVDIYSCNWGPVDDGLTLEGPGPETTKAIERGATLGRWGRGSIYVWAAGNGEEKNDNCNYDGFANNPYTIAVGAISAYGKYSSYSEPCSAMLITAPGGDRPYPGLTTTDMTGAYGGCSSVFSGTDSSAPQVAGIVALMLEVNPDLTWRDVQTILMRSGRRIDLGEEEGVAGWSRNKAGHWHHDHYGFGLVNATAAVFTAKTWSNLPVRTVKRSDFLDEKNMSIPEDGTALQFHYELNPGTKQGKRDGEEGMENPMGELEGGKEEKKDGFAVEQVEVYFWAVHPNWGNLAVNLTSPSGTVSRLALAHAQNVSYDDMTNSHGHLKKPFKFQYQEWSFMTVKCWDENPYGQWTLSVRDDGERKGGGIFEKWQLKISGYYRSDAPPTLHHRDPYKVEETLKKRTVMGHIGALFWRFLIIVIVIGTIAAVSIFFVSPQPVIIFVNSLSSRFLARPKRDADGIFDAGDDL